VKETKTTQSLHSINGVYTKEREVIHQNIIKYFTQGEANITIPEAVLTGGGSGAGKSTAVKLYFEIKDEHEGAIRTLIDADEIKKHLPEYRTLIEEDDNMMTAILHDESSDISQKLIELCIHEKRDFLYDGTMKNFPKYEQLIKQLKANNYSVNAIVVNTSIIVALNRSAKRAEEEFRIVPDRVIIESHVKVAETFFKIKDLFDSYTLFDNSGEYPVEIASKYDDEVEISDPIAVDSFFIKSKLKIDELIFQDDLQPQH